MEREKNGKKIVSGLEMEFGRREVQGVLMLSRVSDGGGEGEGGRGGGGEGGGGGGEGGRGRKGESFIFFYFFREIITKKYQQREKRRDRDVAEEKKYNARGTKNIGGRTCLEFRTGKP